MVYALGGGSSYHQWSRSHQCLKKIIKKCMIEEFKAKNKRENKCLVFWSKWLEESRNQNKPDNPMH